MKIKRVLAIHDLCSFGRCSLTAAVPVLSAMGHQSAASVTALYSNNLTYGKFVNRDLTGLMASYREQWKALGCRSMQCTAVSWQARTRWPR